MLADAEMGITSGTNVSSSPLLNQVPGTSLSPSLFPPTLELRGPILDVGIFRDTLLPSISFNASLSLVAYGVARSTDKVEIKDFVWPLAPLANAWWSSIGRRVIYHNVSVATAVTRLSRPEKLLLGGLTLWSSRLLYRVISRSAARKREQGKNDDDRYEVMKKEEGVWTTALWKVFLPEAIAQTIMSLPFVAPFRHQGAVFTGYHPIAQAVSVGLFFTGLFLEGAADAQLDRFKRTKSDSKMCKEGVWSIVRHPNYLGDALIHFSFPLLLFSSDMLAPVELLGPIANYLFLRFVGGDKQTEESQAERYIGGKKADFDRYQKEPTINSFWPHWEQIKNQWTWIVIGAGVVGAGVEQAIHLTGLE